MSSPGTPRRAPRITGFVVAILGLALALGGVWLVALGGSAYYLVAGAGVCATGILLARGSGAALWLYAIVLLGTIVWAVAEVGLVGWQLEPRLLLPVLRAI